MKPDKDFVFKITVNINPGHPLYDKPDNVIRGELGLMIMNGMSLDPMIGYECDVIK
jgi:DNA integrity scanning protein DisA with diadenylate cyclase activity